MESKTCAGIVTYNPDITKLKENIDAVKAVVDSVVIVDNCSEHIDEIARLAEQSDCELIRLEKNEGIAFALNRIMEEAKKQGYDWCVTLDQDSVVPGDLIREASKLYDQTDVCMIVPMLLDVNTGDMPSLDAPPNEKAFQEVPKCITSASITNIAIWSAVGGFDEELFIDYVDYDYAAKCRKAGYRIIRMNRVTLRHEFGESVMKRLLWLRVRVANHSPFRKYYICRNLILYVKRYKKDKGLIHPWSEILRLIKLFLIILLFEDGKGQKFKAAVRGVRDGLKKKERS